MNAAAVAARFAEGWGRRQETDKKMEVERRSGRGGGGASMKRSHWKRASSVCEGKGESYGERERGGLVRKTIVPFKFTGVEYLI